MKHRLRTKTYVRRTQLYRGDAWARIRLLPNPESLCTLASRDRAMSSDSIRPSSASSLLETPERCSPLAWQQSCTSTARLWLGACLQLRSELVGLSLGGSKRCHQCLRVQPVAFGGRVSDNDGARQTVRGSGRTTRCNSEPRAESTQFSCRAFMEKWHWRGDVELVRGIKGKPLVHFGGGKGFVLVQLFGLRPLGSVKHPQSAWGDVRNAGRACARQPCSVVFGACGEVCVTNLW